MRTALIICFLFSTFSLHSQIFNEVRREADTTLVPIIDFKTDVIYAADDTSQFLTRDVVFLNRGEGELKITKISASCYCSNGYILENNIYPLSAGKIRLDINKHGLDEGQDSVVFTIYSNAKNSPVFLTVTIKEEEIEEEEENCY